MYIPIWLIIIILILIANLYLKDWRYRKNRQCVPFSISILPAWRSLLTDYHVINEEQWNSLHINKGSDQSSYNVLENGINFTVLKSDSNSELIYSEDLKKFYSQVDFRVPITEIDFSKEVPAFHPRFYIRTYIEGYEIGVTTMESTKKQVLAGDNMALVPVTVLPYCIFRLPRYRYGILKKDEEDKMLKKYGWEKEELDAEERLAGFPYTLTHKYFRVYYEYI